MNNTADDRCQICTRPLHEDDHTTCLNCVNQVRNTIRDIVDLYAELPDAIRTITGISYDPFTSRSSDVHVPGGQALVLLSPGTEHGVTSSRTGKRDHVADHYPNDPPSAAGVLATIEDDWRAHRHDRPADYDPDVTRSAEYLTKHVAWAARVHPAFTDTARTLRNLRHRMERVTGNTPPKPETSVAPCIACGGELRQRWGEAGELEHECAHCGRIHDQTAYRLAIRARLEVARRDDTLTLTAKEARELYRLSEKQIYVWEYRGKLAPIGETENGVKLYSNHHIATLAQK